MRWVIVAALVGLLGPGSASAQAPLCIDIRPARTNTSPERAEISRAALAAVLRLPAMHSYRAGRCPAPALPVVITWQLGPPSERGGDVTLQLSASDPLQARTITLSDTVPSGSLPEAAIARVFELHRAVITVRVARPPSSPARVPSHPITPLAWGAATW